MADGQSFGFGFGSRLSLFAQDGLRRASDTISQSLERLSSGQRINSAVDDPASLSVASKLKADKGVYTKAIENVNQGITLNNMAYEGLTSLEEIATRQVELATQAESETLSHAQRVALNDEANALVDEYNRIVQVTDWNDLKPYDGSLKRVSIQAGYGANAAIPLQYGQDLGRTAGAQTFGTGTFTAPVCSWETVLSDLNEDGNLDLITTSMSLGGAYVSMGNGDGTFGASVSYAMGAETYGVVLADLDDDGDLDMATTVNGTGSIFVAMGNGNGTFAAGISYSMGAVGRNIEATDLDNDGDLDLVADNRIAIGRATVFKNNGDGTFASAVSYALGLDTRRVRTGDFNSDGIADIIAINSGSDPSILIGNGDGTFKAQVTITGGSLAADGTIGDFNGDGYLDIAATTTSGIQVLLGNGDGTFKSEIISSGTTGSRAIDAGDFNNDGISDVIIANADSDTVSLHLGVGDGTFSVVGSWAVGDFPMSIAAGDVNNDGILDAVAGNEEGATSTVLTQQTTTVTTIPRLNLMSAENAATSADLAAAALSRVTGELGIVSAQSSRLSTAVLNLQSVQLAYGAGYQRIMEVDVAQETARYLGAQIVQNGATAMLAQANLETESVIKLLEGVIGMRQNK